MTVETDSLDAAWTEAEAAAALKGWTLELRSEQALTIRARIYWASVDGWELRVCEASGSTPTAALRALVARLAEEPHDA